MAGASVRAYAPGLVGFILVKVLAPGYFARQDTRTPVRVGVQALSLGMALNVVFVLTLAATRAAPAHAGIAAATACSGLFNATFLLRGLVKSGIYRPRAGWRDLALVVTAANVLMAVVLLAVLHALGDWLELGRLARLGRLGLFVAGGAAVYLSVCAVLGLRPRDLRAHAV
jgi:putative peptidoglycan lipid II flippase